MLKPLKPLIHEDAKKKKNTKSRTEKKEGKNGRARQQFLRFPGFI